MKVFIGFLFTFLFTIQNFAQTLNPFHQTLANQVSQSNILQHLTDFENFGVKTFGSQEEDEALNWLISFYQSMGYTDIETQTVSAYGETGSNLIVTKTGTVYPDTYVIIDAHYDTINGPGTNDNGSGTSILMELARIFANVQTEYSIKFIHFTAEEWGLIGSQQYVDEVVIPQNLDIRLVFNIDQVGGVAGMNNNKVVCEKDIFQPHGNDSESAQITQELSNCISLYSDLGTVTDIAYGSDYIPFQDAGYVITGLYEYNESDHPHTPTDTLENMDPEYVFQIAKGSAGALAYFAKAYQNMGVNDSDLNRFKVYPNPADQLITIQAQPTNQLKQISLIDFSGRTVFQSAEKLDRDLIISTSQLPNGNYILRIDQNSYKIIVQHK